MSFDLHETPELHKSQQKARKPQDQGMAIYPSVAGPAPTQCKFGCRPQCRASWDWYGPGGDLGLRTAKEQGNDYIRENFPQCDFADLAMS